MKPMLFYKPDLWTSKEYTSSIEYFDMETTNGISPYERILGKGLLNEIHIVAYSDNRVCERTDPECGVMITGPGRTDGENYFVAGYRNQIPLPYNRVSPLYYVINDKVYVAEDWNIAGITQEKFIVKRLINKTENRKDWTVNFTLETCEVAL
jgi:hypothetical protein